MKPQEAAVKKSDHLIMNFNQKSSSMPEVFALTFWFTFRQVHAEELHMRINICVTGVF
jgi:hypothetical protein